MSAIDNVPDYFILGSSPGQIGNIVIGVKVSSLQVDTITPATTGGTVAIDSAELNTAVTGDVIGVANGLATLDATGVIPLAQIPPSISGSSTFNVYVRMGPGSAPGPYIGSGPAGPGHIIESTGTLITLTTVGIDGITALSLGDRVLVDDGTANTNNGIYTITDMGNPTPWSMTRATDFDDSLEVVYGSNVYVASGDIAGGEGYRLVTANPIVVDTTPLQFNRFTNTYPTINPSIQNNGTLLYENDSTPKTLFTFISPGTAANRPPTSMTFIYNISGNASLSTITWSLVNVSNSSILLTGIITPGSTYTNDTTATVDLSSIISSWPSSVAIIEFQAIYTTVGVTNTNITFFRSILFY